jgi:hypothetical protein
MKTQIKAIIGIALCCVGCDKPDVTRVEYPGVYAEAAEVPFPKTEMFYSDKFGFYQRERFSPLYYTTNKLSIQTTKKPLVTQISSNLWEIRFKE